MRIGFGYDVHRLVAGRRLILGGIEIPFEKGLMGHSDADVLLHAISDALLGAANEGDIGRHFPDTDPAYKDISSMNLLCKVVNIVKNKGYKVEHIDCSVVAEQPHLSPYIDGMRNVISREIGTDKLRISIKAKTSEGLGPVGKGECIEAYAVCLLGEQ